MPNIIEGRRVKQCCPKRIDWHSILVPNVEFFETTPDAVIQVLIEQLLDAHSDLLVAHSLWLITDRKLPQKTFCLKGVKLVLDHFLDWSELIAIVGLVRVVNFSLVSSNSAHYLTTFGVIRVLTLMFIVALLLALLLKVAVDVPHSFWLLLVYSNVSMHDLIDNSWNLELEAIDVLVSFALFLKDDWLFWKVTMLLVFEKLGLSQGANWRSLIFIDGKTHLDELGKLVAEKLPDLFFKFK